MVTRIVDRWKKHFRPEALKAEIVDLTALQDRLEAVEAQLEKTKAVLTKVVETINHKSMLYRHDIDAITRLAKDALN